MGASCNSEDITLTIHGFLGTFEALLYETSGPGAGESVEERAQERSSIISIAPHSFSVGMFSWFPLVSIAVLFEHLHSPPFVSQLVTAIYTS